MPKPKTTNENPSTSVNRRKKKKSILAAHPSFEDGMKGLRLNWFILENVTLKKKKHWKSASFPASPSLLLSYWMRNTVTIPQTRPTRSPLFLQWRSAARRWNSWTHIRDLFLPEWAEKQRSFSILCSRIAFIFLECAYCTLDSGYV